MMSDSDRERVVHSVLCLGFTYARLTAATAAAPALWPGPTFNLVHNIIVWNQACQNAHAVRLKGELRSKEVAFIYNRIIEWKINKYFNFIVNT